jgi:hypothetical protein
MVERSEPNYSINPRSDAYPLFIFAVKSREFREEGPDRKHHALAKKGQTKLSQSVLHWTKMMEILEHYRETHEALFRYKSDDAKKNELSKILIDIGQSLKNNNSIEITKVLPPKDKVKTATTTNTTTTASTKSATTTTINPVDPIAFKFLYAKENQKLEIHIELEWTPE